MFSFKDEYYPFKSNIAKAKILKKQNKQLVVSITKKIITIAYYDSHLDGTNSFEMQRAIKDLNFLIA